MSAKLFLCVFTLALPFPILQHCHASTNTYKHTGAVKASAAATADIVAWLKKIFAFSLFQSERKRIHTIRMLKYTATNITYTSKHIQTKDKNNNNASISSDFLPLNASKNNPYIHFAHKNESAATVCKTINQNNHHNVVLESSSDVDYEIEFKAKELKLYEIERR